MAALPTPWPDAPRDESAGALIRRHRLARAWSQERLAAEADIEVGTLRRIETGRRPHPRRPTLATLASVLGMEAEMAACLATPDEGPSKPAPVGAAFGPILRRYRLRSGHSQASLAKVVGINASYINRMESGEREAPGREVAGALARALPLAPEEIDRLIFAAGHVPPGLQKLGPADSTIAAVTRLLTNDALSPESRADARAVIETLCIRWSDQVSYPGVPSGALRAVEVGR